MTQLLAKSVLVLLVAGACTLLAQNGPGDPITRDLRPIPRDSQFTTPAYKEEVARLLVKEADAVARDLGLPEPLPIKQSNLVEVYIAPPGLGIVVPMLLGALGHVATSNYAYHVNMERKFSCLIQNHLLLEWPEERKRYLWPMSRLDTNAAFRIATNIMIAAGMDVSALNRECKVEITATFPEGPSGEHFVPDYWVEWRMPGAIVAFVEFLQPGRVIRQLKVTDAKYARFIKREAIAIPNIEELLTKGVAPAPAAAIKPAWRQVEDLLSRTNGPQGKVSNR